MIRSLIILFLVSPPLFAQCAWEVRDSAIGKPFERWEATATIASECDPQYSEIRDRMLDSLVRFTGVNRLRVEVRAGSENPVDHYAEWRAAGCPTGTDPAYVRWLQNQYVTVNDNNDSTTDVRGFHFTELDATIENVVIPLRTRLEAKGEDLHVNVCYVAFTDQNAGGTYLHDQPNEYAEFVSAVYQHLKTKWNIVPDRWEAVLEPDRVSQWTASKLGAALDAAALRLRTDGIEPSFIAPSTSNTSNTIPWAKDIIAYPNAKAALKDNSLFDITRNGDSLSIVGKRTTVTIGLFSRFIKPGAVRLDVCREIVMKNTDGSFVGYQWPPYLPALSYGWPTGEVEYIRVDSLVQEHTYKSTRTQEDSSQYKVYEYFLRRTLLLLFISNQPS
ncbi:MAG: hypothetical protein IPP80_13355 [Ignavibacteria bacterium]|nr:hypothetical protein [Ignavibacteria bacterium]